MDDFPSLLAAGLAFLLIPALGFPWFQHFFERRSIQEAARELLTRLGESVSAEGIAQILLDGMPAKQTCVILRDRRTNGITLFARPEPAPGIRQVVIQLEAALARTSISAVRFASRDTVDDSYVMRIQSGSMLISAFAVGGRIPLEEESLQSLAASAQEAVDKGTGNQPERRRQSRHQASSVVRTQSPLPISPTQMLSRVAHDLRLPMTNLELTLERLQNESGGTPARELAERAARQLQILESLTHSVVHVNSGRSADPASDPPETNLAEETRAALDSFQEALDKKKVRVTVEMPDSLVVRCRPVRARRILFNLISNAVRYAGSPGFLHICAQAAGDFVQWEIQDSGPGLDCSSDLFFGLSRQNLGRTGGGFGIGLASSRDLARESGGDLTGVPSESGARFLLVLPAGACLVVPGHDPSQKYNGATVGPLRAV